MTDRIKLAIAELTRLRDQVPKKGLDEKQTAEYLGMWQGLENARLALIQRFDTGNPTYAFRRRAARRLRDELPKLAREWANAPQLVRDDYDGDEQRYVASVASGLVMTTPVDEE